MRKLGVLAVCLAAVALVSCGESAPKIGAPPTATAPAPGSSATDQPGGSGQAEPDIGSEAEQRSRIEAEERRRIDAEQRSRIDAEQRSRIEAEQNSGSQAEPGIRGITEPGSGGEAEPGFGSSAPDASPPAGGEQQTESKPRPRSYRAEPSAEATEDQPTAASPPPAGYAPPAPSAPSAPAPSAPPEPDPVGAGPPPEPAPPAPGGDASAASADWDVVPVFFGTDRAQQPNEKRLDYGSERGRRLELGRALVTVPKAHKVPAIERPWVIRVPYLNVTLYEEAEDPTRHFTMDEIKALDEEQFLALVRERIAASARYKDHAFIFVHGYNTSFDYALYRTAQIAYDLKFDSAAFAYSWPSGGGLASYTYDRESSGQAEPFLKQFMELVINKTGAKSVSVIAHSMGNQPTLQVLRDLRRSTPDGVRISQIILAAPDVDRDNFENIAQEIQGLADGVTLYAAGNDKALQVSRNFYGGIPRAGDVPATGPLVLPGVDTIDVSAASLDSLGLNHSGYAENNAILADIAALLETGTRPPKLRTPSLEEVTTTHGVYWRYPAAH